MALLVVQNVSDSLGKTSDLKASSTQSMTLAYATRIFLLGEHDFLIKENLHWLGNVREGHREVPIVSRELNKELKTS